MSSKVSMEGTKHAVFSIDPGETSGIAAGVFTIEKTVKETLQGARRLKTAEVGGTKDSWLFQGREIARLMNRFAFAMNAEERIRIDHIHYVCEDFVLRRRVEGGATGNLTSVWVAAAARSAFLPDNWEFTWQQPSAAKTFATNDRLKLWGLYEHTVGSEHKRDAIRHLALRVNGIVD